MAYANKKYHSGWMCVGVTRELAGVKFSGSEREVGKNSAKVARRRIRIKKPNTSLYEK